MSKKVSAPTPANKAQPKVAEKKQWKAEDYATLTVPIEEVKDIKIATCKNYSQFSVFTEDTLNNLKELIDQYK